MIVKEEARYTKAVNIVFALGLVPFVMQFAVRFVFSYLKRIFPDFFEQNVFWTDFFLSNFVYIVSYTVLILFLAQKVTGRKAGEYFSGEKVSAFDKTAYIFIFLCSATVLSFLWGILRNIINVVFGAQVIGDYTALFDIPVGFAQIAAYFFLTTVVAAVCEELIMRAVFCGILADFNEKAAMVLSSLAFAFFHYTFTQAPYAFFTGLILARIYLKTRSFFMVFLLHFLNNMIAAFYTLLSSAINDPMIFRLYIFTQFCIVCGGICFSILYFSKHKTKETKIYPVSGKSAWKYALASPVLWLSFVVFALYSFIINMSLI